MKPTDIELETTSGKPTTVLTLLEEMKARWHTGDIARDRAKAIERWVYNRFNGRSWALETSVSVPMNVPPVSKNKLRSLLLTWAARTTKRRDTAIAYANEATPGDLAAAEVANAILDHQRQLQDRDALMMRGVIVGGMHTTFGLYNTFDPDAGPFKEREPLMDRWNAQPMRDENGEVVYKDVEGKGAPNLEVLSIFDFVTSGEREAHKGKWCLIRRWLDPDEANSLLRAKAEEMAKAQGLTTVPNLEVQPQPVQNRQGTGPTRDAVEAYEMWWRPNPMGRLKDGLFAAVVGGYVVRATTFPYEHGELPLVVVRVMDVEDEFYGATWLEDAVPQQMGLNQSLRVLAYRAEIAAQMRILGVSGVMKKWGDSSDGVVECDDIETVANGVNVISTDDIPTGMMTMCDRYEQGIDDCAGISGVSSSGDTAAETKNARLVAYATQVDEQKNEHTLRNLQEAELVIDAQQLKMYQQLVSRQRLVRIIGEDNAISASYFSGAEIRGVDVRLEAGPAEERSRAGMGKDADERMQMGTLDPRRGGEMSQTGLSSTVDEGEQRQRIMQLMQQALAGQPVQADPTIDPDIAVTQLQMAVQQMAPNGARFTMPLRALLQEYMQLAAQGQQEQMPQAPQPGKKGAMPQQQQNQLPGGIA